MLCFGPVKDDVPPALRTGMPVVYPTTWIPCHAKDAAQKPTSLWAARLVLACLQLSLAWLDELPGDVPRWRNHFLDPRGESIERQPGREASDAGRKGLARQRDPAPGRWPPAPGTGFDGLSAQGEVRNTFPGLGGR